MSDNEVTPGRREAALQALARMLRAGDLSEEEHDERLATVRDASTMGQIQEALEEPDDDLWELMDDAEPTPEPTSWRHRRPAQIALVVALIVAIPTLVVLLFRLVLPLVMGW